MNSSAPRTDPVKIACLGQAVMDVIIGNVRSKSLNGEITKVNYVKHLPGGHAINHALCLRKLGMATSIIGRVGADRFGLDVLKRLKDSGVDVSGLVLDPTLSTSVSVIIVDPSGEKTIFQNQTGNNAFNFDLIDLKSVENALIVCLGSLWTLPGLDGDGVAQLFAYARERNIITVADTGEDSKYVGIAPIITALRYTDYFLPSNREAYAITGLRDLDAAADALLEMGPKAVIIRLGADGCLVATKHTKRRVPTLALKPVDTTGACDNFMAGFLTKLSEGADLIQCAAFANTAGALSTLSVGANSAEYCYDSVQAGAIEILARMSKHDLQAGFQVME